MNVLNNENIAINENYICKNNEWMKGTSSWLEVLINEIEEDKLGLKECTFKMDRNKFNNLRYNKRENVGFYHKNLDYFCLRLENRIREKRKKTNG